MATCERGVVYVGDGVMAEFSKAKQANRKPKAKKPLKRGSLVKSTAIKRNVSLKRQSVKGKAYQAEFEAMKAKMLPCWCGACHRTRLHMARVHAYARYGYYVVIPQGAVTLHHIRTRKRGGDNSKANLLPVCDACHKWIHANPKEATQLGLLKSRYQGDKQ